MLKVTVLDEVIGDHIILEVNDLDSGFYGIKYYYEGLQFAEEENPDGSMNLSFNYNVVKGNIPPSKKVDFELFIGDQILAILEEQIKNNEVIYGGGVDA